MSASGEHEPDAAQRSQPLPDGPDRTTARPDRAESGADQLDPTGRRADQLDPSGSREQPDRPGPGGPGGAAQDASEQQETAFLSRHDRPPLATDREPLPRRTGAPPRPPTTATPILPPVTEPTSGLPAFWVRRPGGHRSDDGRPVPPPPPPPVAAPAPPPAGSGGRPVPPPPPPPAADPERGARRITPPPPPTASSGQDRWSPEPAFTPPPPAPSGPGPVPSGGPGTGAVPPSGPVPGPVRTPAWAGGGSDEPERGDDITLLGIRRPHAFASASGPGTRRPDDEVTEVMAPVPDETMTMPPVPAGRAGLGGAAGRGTPAGRPGPAYQPGYGPGGTGPGWAPPGPGPEGPRRGPRGWMPAGLQAMTASRNGRLGIVVGVLVVAGAALLLIPVLGSGSSPAPTAHPQTVSTVSPSSVTATASSTERTEGNVTYTAANTLDGDPATAWNSNGDRDGPGPGIWLRYSFSTPLDLRGITVLNGYQKVTPRANKPPLDLYQANERLHRVKVTTQTGSWTWDLQDSRTPQTFSQKLGRTSWVKLQIVSVYPSTAYRDVGLSDISFTAAQ